MPFNHPNKKTIVEFSRKDFTSLNSNLSVEQALSKIRTEGLGERIVYFYVVDEEEKLIGVLPTRKLLMANPDEIISNIMIKKVISINKDISLYDALEYFVLYKFLAFPVVDDERRIVGIVDVNEFTEEIIDTSERINIDNVFETIGFRITEIKNASALKSFQLRFPWLITTILSGIVCAIIASFFKVTLEQSILIAFFMTMILGLGESISIQSMTIAIQILHSKQPTIKWFLKNLTKEFFTSFLLGLASSIFVFVAIIFWKNNTTIAALLSLSIIAVEVIAAFWGLTVPYILHRTKLDPKISAGPITLALADISTVTIYLGLASIVFKTAVG